MPWTLSLTSASPRSAVAVTAWASWFVSLARRRTASMPVSTAATKLSASLAKRASSSPADGDVGQPLAHGLHQLAGVVGELVQDGERAGHLLAAARSSPRARSVVSWAKVSSCSTRLPAAWRLSPMLATAPSERSTAAPCRRAASSSMPRLLADTLVLVRCRFTVTRCTWEMARRSDTRSRRTSSRPSNSARVEMDRSPSASRVMMRRRVLPRRPAQAEPGEPPTQQVERGRHQQQQEPPGHGARLSRECAQQPAQDRPRSRVPRRGRSRRGTVWLP